jgi:hypothetical protein
VTVWDIRAGVGSDVSETFRALAALVVRGSVEREGATFRVARSPVQLAWRVP